MLNSSLIEATRLSNRRVEHNNLAVNRVPTIIMQENYSLLGNLTVFWYGDDKVMPMKCRYTVAYFRVKYKNSN